MVARETLTREQIVREAIDLMDADGAEGLNLRALGARLGSAATAVYWHVGSKDNLMVLAGDAVWHEIALPDPGEIGWRESAARMAGDLHAMLVRHTWLVQIFGTHMIFGPGKARHDDHLLSVYEAGGFVGADADRAATTVFTYVLGNALGAAAAAAFARRLDRADGEAAEQQHTALLGAREIAAGFPRLAARLDTPAADYAAAPTGSFAFGLETILDGLQARLATPAEGPESR